MEAPRNQIRNSRILVVPDLHMPYGHQDTVPFLKALKAHVKPTRVILLGDEVDKHALSFHDSDPDLSSAGDELKAAVARLKPLYALFPEADVLESNHGSLVYRRALHHGIPRTYLRHYREVLEAPTGWHWHPQLTVTSGKQRIFFTHGMIKNGKILAERRGLSTVQGHFHTEFYIQYSGNPEMDVFSMSCGCLIDGRSLAFAYNSLQISRPILGAGSIIEGVPKLYKMNLNAGGRWNGKLDL